MTSDFHDKQTLDAIGPLREAGFALHWLHPRKKRPIGEEWSAAPVASLDNLRATHARGNNLGVRTGGPSELIDGNYLHILDLDIRIAELADEAWARFRDLFPGVDPDTLPAVISGSGGESRHLYIVTDKPFFSKKLATSEGKHRHFDPQRGRDVWSYDWEIELFGTDKQAAMPPSIHPDTGKPYLWLREFDLDSLGLGLGPFIPSAVIERLEVAEVATYEFETRDPLTFKRGQMERDLEALPDERIDDYHDWVMLGQALHHQFGASDEGFGIWVEQSKRSSKFDGSQSGLRDMKRKWRGFGKNRRQPVTMATVRQWAADARQTALLDQFEDEPEAFEGTSPPESDGNPPEIVSETPPKSPPDTDEFDDLIGGSASNDDEPDDDIEAAMAAATAPGSGDGKLAWDSLLDVNEEGGFKPTLHNVELIVANDPRLVGLPQRNAFTQETVQRTPPGTKKTKHRRNGSKANRQLSGPIWQVRDTLNGEIWSSARDFAVRSILEAPKTQGGYGMQITDRNLQAAIVLSAWENSFHPVQEYLTGLAWDGKSRVESLFVDYLHADDTAYARNVARLMMVAGVTRIFEPGHKYDFAVILEGIQGKRKSSFIKALGKNWFAELDGNFHDPKEMVEKMQGSWIMEIPELSAFNKSDVQSIKAFISRQVDKVRLAYEKRADLFPRQCIFIGSTNDREYLKDATGGRRFWPMECHADFIDIATLLQNVDQLWAEAVTLYRAMRAAQPLGELPLYLADEEAAAEAARLQESRRQETADDATAGRIAAWLDRPVNSGGMDDDDPSEPRNVTCLMQIWVECLSGDPRSYDNIKAQQLGRAMRLVPGWYQAGKPHTFPNPYGRQRCYERAGSLGRYAELGMK